MAERYIYLARHGQYERDPRSPRFGALTASGRRQARRLARRVRDLPIDTIIHSDMPRARETAAIVSDVTGIDGTSSRLLREGLPPSRLPIVADGAASLGEQRATRGRFRRARARFVRRTRGADRHELIVCHGNLIRFLVLDAMGLDARRWMALRVPWLASLTLVMVTPRLGARLCAYNDASHLAARDRLIF